MERIVYRKTLDVHKNGIQFTLQGFETADNMARRIEISLMASGDTIDLPLEQLVALMYITTPNATEPSINECTIKNNTIIYDVLPIVEEGITEMQLKLIDTRPECAKGVLASPRFAVEVLESNASDDNATQTTTYTALENALARAKGVYDARLTRIEIDTDCTFRAYFADGTVYETDALHEALYKGEALMAQSFARGDSGIREGEETDNSLYYSNVSKSASAEASKVSDEASELLQEAMKHGVYTAFSINFESGEIEYISPAYTFHINKETGKLDVVGKTYTPDGVEYYEFGDSSAPYSFSAMKQGNVIYLQGSWTDTYAISGNLTAFAYPIINDIPEVGTETIPLPQSFLAAVEYNGEVKIVRFVKRSGYYSEYTADYSFEPDGETYPKVSFTHTYVINE